MSFDENHIKQFTSAGLVFGGLLATVASSLLFRPRVSIKEISVDYPVSWSPRGIWGLGDVGKSPIFGIMWTSIYLLSAVLATALTIEGSQHRISQDPDRQLTCCGLLFSGLAASSLWPVVIGEPGKCALVAASMQLCIVAITTLCGAILSKVFLMDVWFDVLCGMTLSLFSGWAIVATGLNIGIVTFAYNHGKGAQQPENAYSFAPLILSVLLGAIAILFANPILPAPLLISTFFMKGVLEDWRIWSATIVCFVCISTAVGMTFVYRAVTPFW